MTALVRAYVGLGANLGDAAATLERALVDLSHLPQTQLVARSGLYRSAPIDASGPDFINAVCALDTPLPAAELLAHLHAIEAAGGRVRGAHHAPRTLDLDLLSHGDQCSDEEHLRLPHPRAHQRAFVLVPWAEIAPDALIPGHGTVRNLLANVAQQRIERLRS